MSDDDEIKVRPVGSYEWVHLVSSVDFGATKTAKGVAGRTIKGVAWRLAFWGNADGSEVNAGPARVSVICEVDYKTAKAVLGVLRKCGLLKVVRRGRGPASDGGVRVGDECRLTVPVDINERLTVRSEDEIRTEIEAVRIANRKKPAGPPRPRKSPGLRGQQTPVTPAEPTGVTGEMVPEAEGLRGKWGPGYGVNGSAVPTQDLPLKEHLPISLSGEQPSVPDDRISAWSERDEKISRSTPKSLPHRLARKYGVPDEKADYVIDWITGAYGVGSDGWWVKADSTQTLGDRFAEALDDYDAIMAERAREEAREAAVATAAPCRHGTPEGTTINPNTGKSWFCALCRYEADDPREAVGVGAWWKN